MTSSIDLVKRIYNDMTTKYGPSFLWGQPGHEIPEGLRLEIGGELYYRLMADPGICDPFSFANNNLDRVFRVPTRVSLNTEASSWRLVIVSEEVISEGIVDE